MEKNDVPLEKLTLQFEAFNPFPTPHEQGLSKTSVENHVRALRAFFNWLHREEYIEDPVLARLKPPRVPKTLVEPLTDVVRLSGR